MSTRSFSYGKTIHAQPLSEKGRDNFDRIFAKDTLPESEQYLQEVNAEITAQGQG